MRITRRAPVLLVLALTLALAAAPARAQEAVSVQVEAGYDGYYSTEGVTPVRVVLANAGPSVRARVELDAAVQGGRVRHNTDVDLPQNSRKAVTLYPAYTGLASKAQVRVLGGEKLIARGEDKLSVLDADATLWGVLGQDTGAYAPLASRSGAAETAVALLSAGSLPDRPEALLGLDTVVVDGVPADGLSEGQVAALRAWVELGGTLLVAGGPDAARNAAGLGALLPVTLGPARNGSEVTALAPLAGGKPPPSGGVYAGGSPTDGARVLAASPQGPLLVSRALGTGTVVWLAWSPSAPPFRGWPEGPTLLRGVAQEADEPSSLSAGLGEWELRPLLADIEGAQLPNIGLVAGFLLLYTLVIGPLLYFVLKRRDRRELAWLLIPATTLLFSGAAYGANFLIRAAGTTLRTVEIVETRPGSSASRATTYAGLFSPSRRTYDLALSPGHSVRPTSEEYGGGPTGAQGGSPLLNVEAGERPVLRDVQADVYSLKVFAADRVGGQENPGFEARLTPRGNGWTGELRSTGGHSFADVYFIGQDGAYTAGALAPGRPLRLEPTGKARLNEWEDQGIGGPPQGGKDESRWRTNMVRSIYRQFIGQNPTGRTYALAPNEVIVLAWESGAPSSVSLLDAEGDVKADRLWMLHTSYELKPGPVRLKVAPQLRMDPNTGQTSELVFRLPEGVSAERLSLRFDEAALEALIMSGQTVMDPAMLGAIPSTPEPGVPTEGDPLSAMRMQFAKVEVRDAAGTWVDLTPAMHAKGVAELGGDAGRYVNGRNITARVVIPSGDTQMPRGLRLEVQGRKR